MGSAKASPCPVPRPGGTDAACQGRGLDVSPEPNNTGKSSARRLRPFPAPARLGQQSKSGSLAKPLDGYKKSSTLPTGPGAIPAVAGRTFLGFSPGPGVSRLDPKPGTA